MDNINVGIVNIPISDDAISQIKNTSIDELIAGSISAGISLTGQEGLSSLATQLGDYTARISEKGFAMADAEVDRIMDELFAMITEFLSENGVLDVIKKGMAVTNQSIKLTEKGLNIANSAMTISANMAKQLTQLSMLMNNDVTVIPDAKCVSEAFAHTIKDQIVAKYQDVKQQLLDLYNSMICTSNDAVIDNIIASINGILNTAENIKIPGVGGLDSLLTQYTGHTISEIRYMCNTGFSMINMIARGVQIAQYKADQAEAADAENLPEVNVEVDADGIKDDAKKKAEEAKKRSKEKFEKLQKDFSKEEAKIKFMEWLSQQSFVIQNAFHLVIIKQMIDDIKEQCQKLQNSGIENFVDFLNVIDMIFKIFNLIGYEPGKQGIGVQDFIELANIVASTAVATAKNVSDQITSNANEAINENIQAGRQAADDIQNDAQNAVDDAKNAADNAVNDIENTTIDDIDTYNGEIFKIMSQSYDGKDITIDITIYANPEINSDIRDFLNSYKQTNGKKVFNNAKTKFILDSFQDAWEDEEDITFGVKAKVDNVMKNYIFNVTIEPDEYKKWLKELNDRMAAEAQAKADEAAEAAKAKAAAAAAAAKEKAARQAENAQKALQNTISTLADVNIVIDMSLIEAYFKDKVLMFDFVVTILNALYPVYEILKALAHLLENYKINKEFVVTKQRADLGKALDTIASTYNNLKDIISLENTNFFIVRTDEMAQWIKNTFDTVPDADGLCTVGIPETLELIGHCTLRQIFPKPALSPIKGTTFYFEIDSTGAYTDGTIAGLDNVVCNEDTSTVYYDKNRRSTIASQILRAQGNGEDPIGSQTFIPKTITATGNSNNVTATQINSSTNFNAQTSIDSSLSLTLESVIPQNNDFSQLFRNITVQTDEFEGQQSVNMNDMCICQPVELYDIDENDPKFYEIVELADEYTGGEAIDFKWMVKPGDSINENTSLAIIYDSSKNATVIKSMFSKGYVKSTGPDNNEYWHLYPDSCNRHICLCDTSLGMAVDISFGYINELQKKMQESSEIYNFLINNVIPALYPVMLYNTSCSASTKPLNAFTSFVNAYNDSVEEYVDQIKDESNEDNIVGDGTDFNQIMDNTQKVGNNILHIRNVDMYNNFKNTYNQMISYVSHRSTWWVDKNGTCHGDLFNDCMGLSYSMNGSTYNSSIGDGNYTNYYMSLVANVNRSTDNQYIKSYISLLNGIINNRNKKEHIYLGGPSQINEFNSLFNSQLFQYNNAYQAIYNVLDKGKQTSASFDEVKKYIKKLWLSNAVANNLSSNVNYSNLIYDTNTKETYAQYYNKVVNNDASLNNFYTDYSNAIYQSKNYEHNKVDGPIIQLTNMYMMIRSMGSTYESNGNDENSKRAVEIRMALIKEEAEKLKTFFKDLIAKYETELSYDATTNALKDYMTGLAKQAEWPMSYQMNIGNDKYNLYTFTQKPKKVLPDISCNFKNVDMEDTEIPDISINYNMVADINGPGNITITDYLYWLVYMTNATIFTLPYLANGFDMPPNMTPTPLPAIYFPIPIRVGDKDFNPINIPILNVTVVFGITIRGIWPMPIILVINQNSMPINIGFPILLTLQQAKQQFDRMMSVLENGIPTIIKQEINKLESDNAELKRDMDKFRTYMSIFKSIPVEDKALIEEEFKAAVYDANEDIDEAKKNARDARERRKAEREKKKRDKRQVITREEDLGTGEEPM